MLRTTIMMVLLAGQALAGPWPREKGRTFLAVAGFAEAPETGQSVTGYATVYAEYGLTDTVTVGLDLGSDEDATEKIIGFLRVPLIPADRSLKFALELGAGRLDASSTTLGGAGSALLADADAFVAADDSLEVDIIAESFLEELSLGGRDIFDIELAKTLDVDFDASGSGIGGGGDGFFFGFDIGFRAA